MQFCKNQTSRNCYPTCILEKTGIFVDGHFDSFKIIDSFIEFTKAKNYTDDWIPILTTAFYFSYMDCKNYFVLFYSWFLKYFKHFADPANEQMVGNIPAYVYQIIESLQGRVFVSCLEIQKTKECERMRRVIDTCIKAKAVVGILSYLQNDLKKHK